MNKNRCYNGGNRHKFEERYEIERPYPISGENLTLDAIKALRGRKYIHDICVWCGKVVKPEEKQDGYALLTDHQYVQVQCPRNNHWLLMDTTIGKIITGSPEQFPDIEVSKPNKGDEPCEK